MNILISADSVRPPLTGIGNYCLNLLRELYHMPSIDQFNCFYSGRFLPVKDFLSRQEKLLESNINTTEKSIFLNRLIIKLRGVPFAYPTRAFLQNTKFKIGQENKQRFIYHEPNFILKPFKGPCIVTIHDLSHINYPKYHPTERVSWLKSRLEKTIQRADHIITVSKLVRQELIEKLKVNPKKITSIYLGYNELFYPREKNETQSILRKYNLQVGHYIAFLGSLEPRKGIDLLLDSWQMLPEQLKNEFPLAIAGAPGWCNNELMQRIKKMSLEGKIRFLNFIDPKHLPFFYSGATIFVYPSVYEGFGLPVLEAMASGAPVVCTKDTAMSEFAADAVMLHSQKDKDELASSLLTLLEDDSLRKKMITRGLLQAGNYSWRKCAEETLDIYKIFS